MLLVLQVPVGNSPHYSFQLRLIMVQVQVGALCQPKLQVLTNSPRAVQHMQGAKRQTRDHGCAYSHSYMCHHLHGLCDTGRQPSASSPAYKLTQALQVQAWCLGACTLQNGVQDFPGLVGLHGYMQATPGKGYAAGLIRQIRGLAADLPPDNWQACTQVYKPDITFRLMTTAQSS